MNKRQTTLWALLCLSLTAAAQLPAYTIVGKDTTCQIFVYSPGEHSGLHVAYLDDTDHWQDMGQVVSSDYGPWGSEKRMFSPFVAQAKDGTWRAVWALNQTAPAFAAAYSEDLISWRPQDYPLVRERHVQDPVCFQMDDGSWDIYLKTPSGKRYVHATSDFRTFEEDSIPAEAEDILWQMDTATVNGQMYHGNGFEVPAVHLHYMRSWLAALKREAEADAQASAMAPQVDGPIQARLTLHTDWQKKISDQLMGIFFEDISYAADGGLWAELTQNGDFEYTSADRDASWTATTAWHLGTSPKGSTTPLNLRIGTEQPLSANNAHYALLTDIPIYNTGWDDCITIPITEHQLNFSVWARNVDIDKKKILVRLIGRDGTILSQGHFMVKSRTWQKYDLSLLLSARGEKGTSATDSIKNIFASRLELVPLKSGTTAVDLVSLMPHDTYCGHGLRKDLAMAIADLHPKFVRFPGGCMTHGNGLDNIYRWKETVGPVQDRKPAPNIWRYHQSRKLGFYEYFQWCEDMGAEPLPVLAAGVPCQNSGANNVGVAGQQGGIPMASMPAYVQDVLDLIEWANGDPAVSRWAKLRADAGHPAPFHLKKIGIGNEDLISTVFEERYLMICKAVKQKYPQIEVVGTVGPFHYPSSDYIEGWKVARDNHRYIDAVDEHYYESPGWFINHQDYYDHYDRSQAKVYLGEYASRGRNALDNALAEGIYLCSIERNADIVEMASYAPLLSKDGHSNWSPDLIYFKDGGRGLKAEETSVRLTPSYQIQRLFSIHSGDYYVPSTIDLVPQLKKWVGTSIVRNSTTGITWLKVVNALSQPLTLMVDNRQFTVPAKSWQAFQL